MKNTILILLTASTFQAIAQKTITFKAHDDLTITADLYITNPKSAPFIVLFHQAGWSRGEYKEIAPELNKLGYNCMAIDQRSGGEINGVINKTHQLAQKLKKSTTYVDAEQDMNSAINYVRDNYKDAAKLIIWGSSYSSALVLKIGGERKDVDAILAFSPGEYFESLGKTNHYIIDSAKNIKVPVFICSAKSEQESWQKIFDVIPSKNKKSFLPKTKGNHGSRALWEKFPDHDDYWNAVTAFLRTI